MVIVVLVVFVFLVFLLLCFGCFCLCWLSFCVDCFYCFCCFCRSGCFPWSVCIVPSGAWPENIIRDSFNEYLDKQKRPVLGLFCHFMAKKPIFLKVSGKLMLKSGLRAHHVHLHLSTVHHSPHTIYIGLYTTPPSNYSSGQILKMKSLYS